MDINFSSTLPTAIISAAVAVKKTSSEFFSSLTLIFFSQTSIPMPFARMITESLVIPGSMLPFFGVNRTPFLTAKIFSLVASATYPSSSSINASS